MRSAQRNSVFNWDWVLTEFRFISAHHRIFSFRYRVRNPEVFKLGFGALEVPDWDFKSWSWFGYGHLSMKYLWSDFFITMLILRSMFFKSWFGALEDSGGSRLGFVIQILLWICSLGFIDQCWLFIFDFEGAKNIHVLALLPIWGFWQCWRFLTGIWHMDQSLVMVTGLWYINVPNFGFVFWLWRCKGTSMSFD